MSLFGRRILDGIKKRISHRIQLPVPPYNNPAYWEGVYSNLSSEDAHEWGDIKFQRDLRECRYRPRMEYDDILEQYYGSAAPKSFRNDATAGNNSNRRNNMNEKEFDDHDHDDDDDDWKSCSFEQMINVCYPPPLLDAKEMKETCQQQQQNDERSRRKKILFLGCGNSKLGEDVCVYYNTDLSSPLSTLTSPKPTSSPPPPPKIIQCDISSRVISTMTQRCYPLIQSNQMSVVQDDATKLTLFDPSSIDAIVDKGLIDALYCANDYDGIRCTMENAHRALIHGGCFLTFSYSQPEYLLGKICGLEHDDRDPDPDPDPSKSVSSVSTNLLEHRQRQQKMNPDNMWKSVEVWQMPTILAYRYVKGGNRDNNSYTKSIGKQNKSLMNNVASKQKLNSTIRLKKHKKLQKNRKKK